jgi:hypothetical protein
VLECHRTFSAGEEMTRIKIIFASLCAALTVFWLEADRFWADGSFAQVRP